MAIPQIKQITVQTKGPHRKKPNHRNPKIKQIPARTKGPIGKSLIMAIPQIKQITVQTTPNGTKRNTSEQKLKRSQSCPPSPPCSPASAPSNANHDPAEAGDDLSVSPGKGGCPNPYIAPAKPTHPYPRRREPMRLAIGCAPYAGDFWIPAGAGKTGENAIALVQVARLCHRPLAPCATI